MTSDNIVWFRTPTPLFIAGAAAQRQSPVKPVVSQQGYCEND
jgi:hypothetical protein